MILGMSDWLFWPGFIFLIFCLPWLLCKLSDYFDPVRRRHIWHSKMYRDANRRKFEINREAYQAQQRMRQRDY